MQLKLSPRWRSWVFFLGVGIVLGFYVQTVVLHFAAARLSSPPDEMRLRRALALTPQDAGLHNALGRLLVFAAQDIDRSLGPLRQAVELNPRYARYWLDLATAYVIKDDIPSQRAALEKALSVAPTRLDVIWEAANFFIVSGDTPRALALFREIITHDEVPARRLALESCWRATRDTGIILRQALPPEIEPHFQFLELMIRQQNTPGVLQTWARIRELGQPFAAKRAYPLFNYMVQQADVREAEQIWDFLVSVDTDLSAYRTSDDVLLVNGGFEHGIQQGGFDWYFSPIRGVRVELDTVRFRSGARSLMVSFDGTPTADAGVYHLIAVQPNTAYRLSAHVRSEDLITASGPQLVIQDRYSRNVLLVTEDLIGTTLWRERGGHFTTGPDTRLLVLRIGRQRGDRPIRGTFWIDDVELVEAR